MIFTEIQNAAVYQRGTQAHELRRIGARVGYPADMGSVTLSTVWDIKSNNDWFSEIKKAQ